MDSTPAAASATQERAPSHPLQLHHSRHSDLRAIFASRCGTPFEMIHERNVRNGSRSLSTPDVARCQTKPDERRLPRSHSHLHPGVRAKGWSRQRTARSSRKECCESSVRTSNARARLEWDIEAAREPRKGAACSFNVLAAAEDSLRDRGLRGSHRCISHRFESASR